MRKDMHFSHRLPLFCHGKTLYTIVHSLVGLDLHSLSLYSEFVVHYQLQKLSIITIYTLKEKIKLQLTTVSKVKALIFAIQSPHVINYRCGRESREADGSKRNTNIYHSDDFTHCFNRKRTYNL